MCSAFNHTSDKYIHFIRICHLINLFLKLPPNLIQYCILKHTTELKNPKKKYKKNNKNEAHQH